MLLDDADLKDVVPKFVAQLMNNTGQSCNALSRMLVPRAQYDEAVAIATEVAEKSKPGRSDDPEAFMGPLVSQVCAHLKVRTL